MCTSVIHIPELVVIILKKKDNALKQACKYKSVIALQMTNDRHQPVRAADQLDL